MIWVREKCILCEIGWSLEYLWPCCLRYFSCWPLYYFVLCNTKIHFLETSLFYKHKHYFWKNRFCCLSSFFFPLPFFCLPFVSSFPLVPNMDSFAPFFCLFLWSFFMCVSVCVFFLLFFCVPLEWTTPEVLHIWAQGGIIGSGNQTCSDKITLKTTVHKVLLYIREFQKIDDNYFPEWWGFSWPLK